MFSTAFLDIPAFDSAAGTVQLPGSKSISNRVLLLAALSAGNTRVHDLLDSDDTRVMLDALASAWLQREARAVRSWKSPGLGSPPLPLCMHPRPVVGTRGCSSATPARPCAH